MSQPVYVLIRRAPLYSDEEDQVVNVFSTEDKAIDYLVVNGVDWDVECESGEFEIIERILDAPPDEDI